MGAYRLGVDGTSSAAEWLGHGGRGLSLVAGATGGVMLGLAPHLALGASVQVLGYTPSPVILIGGVEAGSVGRVGMLASAGLVGLL